MHFLKSKYLFEFAAGALQLLCFCNVVCYEATRGKIIVAAVRVSYFTRSIRFTTSDKNHAWTRVLTCDAIFRET